MQRVPNVPLGVEPEAPEPVAPGAPATLPGPTGEPRPVKPYAPDDPAISDWQKPGSAPDILPGPSLGVPGTTF